MFLSSSRLGWNKVRTPYSFPWYIRKSQWTPFYPLSPWDYFFPEEAQRDPEVWKICDSVLPSPPAGIEVLLVGNWHSQRKTTPSHRQRYEGKNQDDRNRIDRNNDSACSNRKASIQNKNLLDYRRLDRGGYEKPTDSQSVGAGGSACYRLPYGAQSG